MRAPWLLWPVFFLAACGGSQPVSPQSPTPPVPNSAPTVTVTFPSGSTCQLSPTSCQVTVAASATDPDGDALTYSWSGCAAGTSAQATCTVGQAGQVAAWVIVSDGHGHSVTASGTALGLPPPGANQPPYVLLSPFYGFSSSSPTLEALGNIIDPEDGYLCGGGYSPPTCNYLDSLTVTGDCRPTYTFSCSCLAGLELDIYRTASSGTCLVTINVKDRQGAVGRSIFTVTYSHGTGAPTASGSSGVR